MQQFVCNKLVNSDLSSCSKNKLSLSLKPVTFFGAQSSLGGCSFCLGGTSSDLGGHDPAMLPVASGLLQVYSNLSNCNYSIFVKDILLEIDFIEEMRTI